MSMSYAKIGDIREYGGERVCVTHLLADIPGGVVLDLTGYKEAVVKEGQVIVHNATDNIYKPLGTEGGSYKALDAGYAPVGVAIATTHVSEPLVGVMTMGQVAKARLPYAITEELAKALPQINFI